jgi:hypothetical protein
MHSKPSARPKSKMEITFSCVLLFVGMITKMVPEITGNHFKAKMRKKH